MPGNGRPHLSVIVPVYDEAARLAASLATLSDYLSTQSYRSEIVVADDGSRDGSFDIACRAAPALSVPLRAYRCEPNRGKGYALKVGIANARGERLLFSDADLATPVEHTADLLAALEGTDGGEPCEVAIGSRKMAGAEVLVHQPRLREMLGKGFTGLTRALLVDAGDVTCGFKAFRADAGRELFSLARLHDWSFDAEILFLAARRGLRVREVPVRWSDRADTKVRLASAIANSLIGLLRIRIGWQLGRYAAPAPDVEVIREWSSGDSSAKTQAE